MSAMVAESGCLVAVKSTEVKLVRIETMRWWHETGVTELQEWWDPCQTRKQQHTEDGLDGATEGSSKKLCFFLNSAELCVPL